MAYLLLLIAAAGIALFLLKRKRAARGGGLREECLREFRMPAEEAEKALVRHLEALKNKHPARQDDWYLEKILYDLRRDRR